MKKSSFGLSIVFVVFFANYFVNAQSNQNIPAPANHNLPLSPKLPQVKLGNKAKNMDLGTCQYLDYYVYYCKPFSCSLKMPVPGSYKLTFKVEEQNGGNCLLNYKFDVTNAQGEKLPFKISCNLTAEGVEAFRYQWKYYSNGYVDILTKRSDDPLLRKQCTPSIEM